MAKAYAGPLLATVLLAGCANITKTALGTDLDQAEPLGLALPDGQPTAAASFLRYSRADRDDYTLLWMAKSDAICAGYKAHIIQVSRDSRLASGLLATVLGGLATVFTPVGTVRALAGAASIANGTGAVFQSDTFNGQVGEILTSAIETARRNQANQIKKNLADEDTDQYRLFASLRDVIEYHDMCSLNTALVQVRVSLQTTQPDGGLTAPARQGQQSSGGLSPEARAEVIRPSGPDRPRNSLGQPRPQRIQAASPRPNGPDGPAVDLTEADMQALRPALSALSSRPLTVGNAQRPNDPRFRQAVAAFQRCKGAAETGFLSARQKAAAVSGDDACLAKPVQPVAAPPARDGGAP